MLAPCPKESASDHIKREADMVRSRWIDKTWWLLAVDCLMKVPVKKCILHVELMYRPCSRCGNVENNSNGRRLHD